MAIDRNLTTLGGGELYLNNVDVGALDGTVSLIYEGEPVDFFPNNKQGMIRRFKASERLRLTASVAEIKAENMRLAMGHALAVTASQSFPSYDPSSYTDVAGASYDIIKFGGRTAVNEVSLRFEHTRPKDSDSNQHKIIVVLYEAVSNFNMTIPFDRVTQTFTDVEFEAVLQPARTAGDQMGFLAVQVLD